MYVGKFPPQLHSSGSQIDDSAWSKQQKEREGERAKDEASANTKDACDRMPGASVP